MLQQRISPGRGRVPGTAQARTVIIGVVLAGSLGILLVRWWTGTGYLPVPAGLPDPGAATSIMLPLLLFARDLCGIAVLGCLFLRCLRRQPVPDAADRRLGQVCARWARCWVGTSIGLAIFTLSDLVGVPVLELGRRPDLLVIVTGTQRMLSLNVTVWVALALALFADRLERRAIRLAATAAAALALLPGALTGHAGHHGLTVLATATLAVHVVAAAIWVGGLIALAVHLRPHPEAMRTTVGRFSAAALWCALAVGASGILEAAVMLEHFSAVFGTARGRIMVLKAIAFAVLVTIGYLHRRRTLPLAATGRLTALVSLATGEIVVMGGALGLAAALAGTA